MKISSKELMKIASDSETTPDELLMIWSQSLSPKVRKAVASNPNASCQVLKAAARLYMEEVLTNPGFEMLKLFDDDPWIRKIGEIYDNPARFFGSSRYIAYRTQEMEQFGRAALISPNIDEACISNLVCYMPVNSIKRVIKNSTIRKRIKSIVVESYNNNVLLMDLEGLFKLWDAELICTLELASFIKKTGAISSMSCRKSVYLKTFRKLNKEYLQDKTSDSLEALKYILIASRGNCFNWISYEIEQDHLPIIAEAMQLVKKIQKKLKTDGTSKPRPAAKTHCSQAMKELAGLIVTLGWAYRPYEDRAAGLIEFYNLVNKFQLPPYEWGSSKKIWPAIRLENELCEALNKLPIQVKAFYVRSMCLGEWFYISRSEIKSNIVEEVNQWLYDRGGIENVLYTSISTKKIIALSENVVIP